MIVIACMCPCNYIHMHFRNTCTRMTEVYRNCEPAPKCMMRWPMFLIPQMHSLRGTCDGRIPTFILKEICSGTSSPLEHVGGMSGGRGVRRCQLRGLSMPRGCWQELLWHSRLEAHNQSFFHICTFVLHAYTGFGASAFKLHCKCLRMR